MGTVTMVWVQGRAGSWQCRRERGRRAAGSGAGRKLGGGRAVMHAEPSALWGAVGACRLPPPVWTREPCSLPARGSGEGGPVPAL